MTESSRTEAARPSPRSETRAVPSTADGLRRENLSRVLTLVHRHGSLTRSRVTHLTGLSRTAVGALLGELVEHGILTQTDPLPTEKAGRPSANYSTRDDLVGVAVNADVRGVRVGFSRLDGSVHESRMIPLSGRPTPRTAAETVAAAITAHREEFPGERLVGIGAAIPGRVDPTARLVTWAPYLEWEQEPFAQALEDRTGLPTRLGYDAELAVTTETMWGAARGSRNTTYIYGGPGGIGGSAIVADRILVGGNNLASRLGHLTVDMDGVECACGSRGCFEPTVAFRHYEAALGDDLSSFADFGAALRATRRPEVSALLDRDAEYLGRVLRSIVLVYDPEMIMLGGFLTGVLEQRRAELERAVAAATLTAISRPPLLQPTQFGADQLLVGAGALAFRGLLDDPADFLLDVDRETSPA